MFERRFDDIYAKAKKRNECSIFGKDLSARAPLDRDRGKCKGHRSAAAAETYCLSHSYGSFPLKRQLFAEVANVR